MRALTCASLILGLIMLTCAGCASKLPPASSGGSKSTPALQPLEMTPEVAPDAVAPVTDSPTTPEAKPADTSAPTDVPPSQEEKPTDESTPIERNPQ